MRAVLAFLAVLGLTIPAMAEPVRPYTMEVSWRQGQVTVPGGFADSISTRTPRANANNFQAADTSVALDLRRFTLPLLAQDGATAVDSIAFFRVDLYPATSTPAVTADTAFLAIQVSNDGIASWVNVTGTIDHLGSGDTPAIETAGSRALEQGSTNAFFWTVTQATGLGRLHLPARSSATAPTIQQLHGWPYIRLIVQGDFVGRYDAKVTGWTAGTGD